MTDELETIRQAQEGSRKAFCDLVRGHHAAVHAFLGRFVRDADLADDLAQEVFLKAYHHLRAYRGDSAFRTWLLAIARQEAQGFLRQEGRRRATLRRSIEGALDQWLEERVEASGDDAGDRWLTALRGCLKTLPEHSGALVRDFYFSGLQAGEIARRSGRKENAVWVALLRVRQALRTCMRRKIDAQEAPA